MAEEPDNLVLEMLRAIRVDISTMKETLADHGQRLSRIELGLAGVRRDPAHDAERVAHVQWRLDQVFERLDRIDKRLGLIEA